MSDITCLALLVSDRVWMENNGKYGMVGIFDSFNVPQFPAQVAPFSLYVRLGYMPKGKNIIKIEVIADKGNLSIANGHADVEVIVDKSIVQLTIPVPTLTLPSPGEYKINLIVNENIISTYVLNANLFTGAQ